MGRGISHKDDWHLGARSRRSATVWVLIVGFLLQPVLAYLVTPLVTHDGKGQQVVVCTLKGSKLVSLDLPQPADNTDTEHCAALKLYQMAGAAQISQPPAPPCVSLYSIGLLDQAAGRTHRSLHFSAYSTRAPPQFS
ncbi:MAG: hypothetical protein LJE59_13155 [Chromatiaceae bacterium]|nr:hypothetical protein [Chromatiaceae bacterium]